MPWDLGGNDLADEDDWLGTTSDSPFLSISLRTQNTERVRIRESGLRSTGPAPFFDVTAYADLKAADDAVAISLSGGTIYLPPGIHDLTSTTSEITISADLWFASGAILRPAADKTVTLRGAITAGRHQIFDVSNPLAVIDFTAGRKSDFRIEWWGARCDGVTDDSDAFRRALQGVGTLIGGGTLRFSGRLKYTEEVLFASRVNVWGFGTTASVFVASGEHAQLQIGDETGASPVLRSGRTGNFSVVVDQAASVRAVAPLLIGECTSRLFESIAISGATGAGLTLYNVQNSMLAGISVTGCGLGVLLDAGCKNVDIFSLYVDGYRGLSTPVGDGVHLAALIAPPDPLYDTGRHIKFFGGRITRVATAMQTDSHQDVNLVGIHLDSTGNDGPALAIGQVENPRTHAGYPKGSVTVIGGTLAGGTHAVESVTNHADGGSLINVGTGTRLSADDELFATDGFCRVTLGQLQSSASAWFDSPTSGIRAGDILVPVEGPRRVARTTPRTATATGPVDDPELNLLLEGPGWYSVRAGLIYNATYQVELAVGWSHPSLDEGDWRLVSLAQGETSDPGLMSARDGQKSVLAAGGDSATTMLAMIEGRFHITAAGRLYLQWADAATGTPHTTLESGSWLEVTRRPGWEL